MRDERFKQVEKLIGKAPPDRLEKYLEMYDRLLLHYIAIKTLSKQEREATINLWSDCVRQAIDYECTRRTDFLESTQEGRMAQCRKEPDGEDVRIMSNRAFDAALNLILQSVINRDQKGEAGDFEIGDLSD